MASKKVAESFDNIWNYCGQFGAFWMSPLHSAVSVGICNAFKDPPPSKKTRSYTFERCIASFDSSELGDAARCLRV